MEQITLPHLKDTSIVLALYKDVKNAEFLRQQLLDGNTAFQYTFLDASVLISRDQVLAACLRSIVDMKNERLRSRNVHSEIVFALSPNNNISESFRRFGLSTTTTHVAVVKIGADLASVQQHLSQVIEGTLVPFNDAELSPLRNEARVRKIYRIEAPAKGESATLGREAESFVIGSMALRGS